MLPLRENAVNHVKVILAIGLDEFGNLFRRRFQVIVNGQNHFSLAVNDATKCGIVLTIISGQPKDGDPVRIANLDLFEYLPAVVGPPIFYEDQLVGKLFLPQDLDQSVIQLEQRTGAVENWHNYRYVGLIRHFSNHKKSDFLP